MGSFPRYCQNGCANFHFHQQCKRIPVVLSTCQNLILPDLFLVLFGWLVFNVCVCVVGGVSWFFFLLFFCLFVLHFVDISLWF